MTLHPLVIVGCGPAGLAAGHASLAAGVAPLVLEAGDAVEARRRDDPVEVIAGVGGAGLFSDGKFSFYPSATRLWELDDRALLRNSYAWTSALVGTHGLQAPGFPEGEQPTVSGDGFKPYPSIYMGLDERVALIESLYAPLEPRVRLRTRVDALSWDGATWQVTVKSERGAETLRAERVIGAGGRFFPLLVRDALPQRFMRLEVGVRIEGPAEHPLFSELVRVGQSIDPKLIVDGPGEVQWRTFCCCRDGELVRSEAEGFTSWSGRSDCPPTGRSNIGFNVRFTSAEAVRGLDLARLGREPFELELSELLASPAPLDSAFGSEGAAALHRGLLELRERCPSLGDGQGLRAVGPSLEGVGDYPATDADLHVPELPIWFAGDAGGTFRGIVAALVSGHYAGWQAIRFATHASRSASTS